MASIFSFVAKLKHACVLVKQTDSWEHSSSCWPSQQHSQVSSPVPALVYLTRRNSALGLKSRSLIPSQENAARGYGVGLTLVSGKTTFRLLNIVGLGSLINFLFAEISARFCRKSASLNNVLLFPRHSKMEWGCCGSVAEVTLIFPAFLSNMCSPFT